MMCYLQKKMIMKFMKPKYVSIQGRHLMILIEKNLFLMSNILKVLMRCKNYLTALTNLLIIRMKLQKNAMFLFILRVTFFQNIQFPKNTILILFWWTYLLRDFQVLLISLKKQNKKYIYKGLNMS